MLKEYSRTKSAVILLLFASLVIQITVSIIHNSVAWDELCFVGAGKAIFSTGYMKYMLLADHPPLSYYISSIPLIPLKFNNAIWQSNSCWKIGHDVLFNSGYSHDKILLLSRLPFVLLSIMLAIYVLKWSTELFGKKSGIIALFLYSFSPSIIAYSGLATADFTVAAMIFIATYYFWKLMMQPSGKNLLLAGIFFGLAQLSKITAMVLVPLFIIVGIAAVYGNKPKVKFRTLIKNLLVIFLIGFVLIWAFHKFQFGTLSESLPPVYYADKAREAISNAPLSGSLLYVYDKVPMPMPIYFGMIGNIFYLSAQSKYNFVLGHITEKSIWYIGLLAFLLKTHLILLVILALLLIFHKRLPRQSYIANLCLILPILLIFAAFSINNKLSGIRHLLAAYMFIFVLASNVVNLKIKKIKALNAAILIMLLFYGISAIWTAPYYLSYTNTFGFGPSNAYKIMVGANIDQGQELLGLKKYLSDNKIDRIKLSYWGSVDPKDYSISYEYIPSPYFQPWQNNYTHIVTSPKNMNEDCSEKNGLVAISVTNLQNVHLINKTCYNWLKNHAPIERIGYSIFIYDVK